MFIVYKIFGVLMNRREFLSLIIGNKQAKAKEDIMSFTANVSPREGNSLVITQKDNLILNATRRNPKADEQGQNVTLPMDQLFEYAYLKPNGAVVIKQLGQEEFTFYPAERKIQAQTTQSELDLPAVDVA
jgi:hypothetical protein